VSEAREYYKRTQDADGALHRMPRYLTAERALVSTLNDLLLYLKLKEMSGHQYILANVFIQFVKLSVKG
jgi:tRNA(Glu) U13 pseudouridine synthase TruD